MQIKILIEEATQNGIEFIVVQDQLICKSKKNNIPSEMLDTIKQHKPEIIHYLSNNQAQNIVHQKREWPLSIMQKSMYYLSLVEASNVAYNMSYAYLIDGEIDSDIARAATTAIIQSHAILRTKFIHKEDEIIQIITDKIEQGFNFEYYSEELHEAEIDNCILKSISQPFNLASPPLIRFSLLQFNNSKAIFIITGHHIVGDQWSYNILLREFNHYYLLLSKNITTNEKKLPKVQFFDYLNEITTASETNIKYWKNKLADCSAMLELPYIKPRPAIQSFRGNTHYFEIADVKLSIVNKICNQCDVTPFMLFFAVYVLLLRILSRKQDLVIGTPIANRNDIRFENTIGYIANMIPLRIQLAEVSNFLELLAIVKTELLQGVHHQPVAFSEILKHTDTISNASYNPLFQVLFIYENIKRPLLQITGAKVKELLVNPKTSKFDLLLGIFEENGKYIGRFEYNTDLFDISMILWWKKTYEHILRVVLEEPNIQLKNITYLSLENYHEICNLSQAKKSYKETLCIQQIFENIAKEFPSKIAVKHSGNTITYRDLQQQATLAANYLIARNIGANDLIAIYFEPTIDLIVAILGVLKAGAAYVPLDPKAPLDRVALIIADAKPKSILTSKAFSGKLISHQSIVITLEQAITDLSNQSTIKSDYVPNQLAYVIYTSGTTGKPKGVAVEHSNVTRLFKVTGNEFNFSARDCWLLFHSYAFDFSVWEIWGALLYGGTLVIPTHIQTRDPASVYNILLNEHITILNQTPSAFYQLLDYMLQNNKTNTGVLRKIIFGGEALSFTKIKPWFERYKSANVKLVNMYGITETTVHVTYKAIEDSDMQDNSYSNIGLQLADLSLYIMDEFMNILPPYVPGEIYVGGNGVARGYLHNETLTNARFVSDPFAHNGKLYRSGDLAMRLGTGELNYLGRIDNQVQIRGFRVELGEIQSAIERQSGIKASVVTIKNFNDTDFLIAYIMFFQENQQDIDLIKSNLKKCLPDYMIPHHFIKIPHIPLTINGKVDYSNLPNPFAAWEEKKLEEIIYNENQRDVILNYLQRLLGKQLIDITKNFFDIGGDSILSLKFLAKLHDLGFSISITDLYQKSIDEILISHIESKVASTIEHQNNYQYFELISKTDRAKLPLDVEDAYPLTYLQLGMLYYARNDATVQLYHDVFSYRIYMPFMAGSMRLALNRLTDCHPVLRTSFHLTGYDEPLQLVHKNTEIPLLIADLTNLSEQEQSYFLQAWIERETRNPFNLESGPLIRLFIHKRSNNFFQLTVSFSHVIIDGWSQANILTSLLIEYSYLLGYQTPELPKKPNTLFAYYVKLEQQIIKDEKTINFLTEYYTKRIKPITREICINHTQKYLIINFNTDLAEKVYRFSKKYSIPQKTILFAAQIKLIAILYQSQFVLTGLANQSRPETEDSDRILGLFLNSVPIYLDLSASKTWLDLIKNTLQSELDVLPYQRLPLAKLQELLKLRRPMITTLFDVINFHIFNKLKDVVGLYFEPDIMAQQNSFDLVFSVMFKPDIDKLDKLYVDYCISMFTQEEVNQLAKKYIDILEQMLMHPDSAHEQELML